MTNMPNPEVDVFLTERRNPLDYAPDRDYDKQPAYNFEIYTGDATDVGGLDHQIGFIAKSLMIDNWTGNYYWFPALGTWIKPYYIGVLRNIPQGTQRLRAVAEAPVGFNGAGTAGQKITVVAFSWTQQPHQGIDVSTSGGVLVGTQPLQGAGGAAAAGYSASLTPTTATHKAYVSGFRISGLGATGASSIQPQLTGVLGGSQNYNMDIPAGVAVGVTPLVITFNPPMPAVAVNTPIVINVPSFGAGNTQAHAEIWGYQT